jgi:altronate dehydratase small subunit
MTSQDPRIRPPETPDPGRMLILDDRDNVGVVINSAPVGGWLHAASGMSVQVVEVVPRGHKIALTDLPRGSAVRKFGEVIGITTGPVARGQHLHVHNTESQRLRGDLARKCPGHLGAHDDE